MSDSWDDDITEVRRAAAAGDIPRLKLHERVARAAHHRRVAIAWIVVGVMFGFIAGLIAGTLA